MTHKCKSPYGCGNLTTVNDLAPAAPVAETVDPAFLPEPMVYGNDKVEIVKHRLEELQIYVCMYKISIDFAIKNISEETIASLVFEAKFYDENGKVLDTILHKEVDFRPGVSRGIVLPTNEVITPGVVKSYTVGIISMTTTETEKVQLRHQALRVGESGEAELDISVKNISATKTDAAVLVTFSMHDDAFIGDKVLILRDIGPEEIRRFSFKYKPHSDAIIDKYTIRIVSDLSEMIEEVK